MSDQEYEDTNFINTANLENNDFRESKVITLRIDAKDVKVEILGKDTFINYTSESHPDKHIIEVVSGHWDKQNVIGRILTLKEQ